MCLEVIRVPFLFFSKKVPFLGRAPPSFYGVFKILVNYSEDFKTSPAKVRGQCRFNLEQHPAKRFIRQLPLRSLTCTPSAHESLFVLLFFSC